MASGSAFRAPCQDIIWWFHFPSPSSPSSLSLSRLSRARLTVYLSTPLSSRRCLSSHSPTRPHPAHPIRSCDSQQLFFSQLLDMTAGPVNRGADGCRWACDRLEVGVWRRPGASSHRCHRRSSSASHLLPFFQVPTTDGDWKNLFFFLSLRWTTLTRQSVWKNAIKVVTYHVDVITLIVML